MKKHRSTEHAKKIWQTGGGGLHPLVERFTVGDDYMFDEELLPYDLHASMAHAEMLRSIGVLTESELATAREGLTRIFDAWEAGTFEIMPEQEDGHTAIEQFLTNEYGEIGKKIHTGRSRNDQSLVMIRLFMKDELRYARELTAELIARFEERAKETSDVPMPGYTHLQKAMPTTVGTWLGSYASALHDILGLLKAVEKLIDQNPLGSASGFGIENFPLDREVTTKYLKFGRTQENPMYCGFSRGYFENIVLQALSQLMIISGRFANDMLLFTTQEFGFVSLPANFTTGSSIMPQKRNYDVFEIMRGNTKVFHAYQSQVQEIVSSLGSGYQRDLQLTKRPFVLGVSLCAETLVLMADIIPAIKVHKATLKKAMTKDLYVTNEVYEEVKKGKSFREAYIKIKKKWNGR